MNERIKELAEQAGFKTDKHGHLFGGDDIKKFAELLVRECAAVAEQWYSDYPSDDRSVTDAVRQHFGVEE